MLDETADMPGNDLASQALLYASGEMEAPDAVAFEQRLGEDQAARDALCQAVEYSQVASGQAPPAPDPAYRDRVRATLRQRRRHMRKLIGQPPTFGPAALWMALGAVVAVLMMLVLSHMATTSHDDPPATKPQTTQPSTAPAGSQGPNRPSLETQITDVGH